MVNNDGLGAALGLGAFPWIINDKGVEMRQCSKRNLRVTAFIQHQRLTRQPFKITMLAKMNDRVDIFLVGQPGIKGEVAMGRHQIGIMIRRRRIDVVAARWLHCQNNIAEYVSGQNKVLTSYERIIFRCTPAIGDFVLDGLRQ